MVLKGAAAIRDLVYPSFCLHCKEQIESKRRLCAVCFALLEFADPATSVTLSTFGPALGLAARGEGAFAEETAKTAAALMVMQFYASSFPKIDFLCPSPEYPFNTRLAEHLSSFLRIPVLRALKPRGLFASDYRLRRTLCFSDRNVLTVGLYKQDIEEFSVLYEQAPREVYFLWFIDRIGRF